VASKPQLAFGAGCTRHSATVAGVQLAILGGTRFIGHAIAEAALWRGHGVAVIHRGDHPAELAGVKDVLVDRGDPSALCHVLKKLEPEVLIDTRAMTRSHAQVTALALKVLGVPGVVLSSVDVYAQFGRLNGLPAPEPEARVREESPLTIPYPFRDIADHEAGPDYDKKDVEQELERAVSDGVSAVTVLRLCAIYGSRDPKRRFGTFVDRIDSGQTSFPMQGGASFRHAHAHVRDVAHAVLLAAEQPGSGYRVLNVSEEDTPTMRERVDGLAETIGVELTWNEVDELPAELESLGRMPNDMVVDSSRIRSALGFSEVTGPEQRLDDVVSWARQSR
jgi:nucleoside-diphosphate-sugar epimerase